MDNYTFTQKVLDAEQTLYNIAKSILIIDTDCEDAVQNAILNAYTKLSSLKNEEYFKTWLVRILINECYNICRRRAKEAPAELPERAAPPGADRELHDALMRLPEEVRTPIVLHYMEGYTTQEIASALRLAQGTVKTRMRRGRDILKKLLSEEELS